MRSALPAGVLHGGPQPTPVPHWAVVLVAVPLLWLLVSGGVVVLDRLVRRIEH